jgi:hypothetical protein
MNITIENLETGVRYDMFTCPAAITVEAHNAYHRGQRSGLVYGNGQRWEWHDDTPGDDDVIIELTRGGEIEDQITIPATGWAAWQVVAAKSGRDPAEWLTGVLGAAMADGLDIRQTLRWLFPRKSEEVQHFETASTRFHGEVRTMKLS